MAAYSLAELIQAFTAANGYPPNADQVKTLSEQIGQAPAVPTTDKWASDPNFLTVGQRIRRAAADTTQPGAQPSMGFSDIPGQPGWVQPPGFQAVGRLSADQVNHWRDAPGVAIPNDARPLTMSSGAFVPTTVAISQGSDQGRAYDHQAGLTRVYQDALKAGLPPEGARAAVAIAQTEGGMGGAVGDKALGGSAGTFQAFFGGGQGNNYARDMGISEAEAKAQLQADPHVANDWALKGYLGSAIKDGLAKGLTGADLATYAQQHGQVSESPERAGQNYAALFGGDTGTQRFLEANAPGESTVPTPTPRHTEINVGGDITRVPDSKEGQFGSPTGSATTNPAEEARQAAIRKWLEGMGLLDSFSKRLSQQVESVDTTMPQYRLPGLPTINLGWGARLPSPYALTGGQ